MNSPPFDKPMSRRLRRASLVSPHHVSLCVYLCPLLVRKASGTHFWSADCDGCPLMVGPQARTHARSPVRAELGVCCTSLLMSLCLVTTVIPTSNMPLCSDEMVDWRHYIIWRPCSLETHKQDSVLNTHWVMLHSLQWLSRGMNDKLILYYVSRPRALWV